MKKLFIVSLSFLLILGFSFTNVYAGEINSDLNVGITATIDLTKGGTQTINTTDKSGNEVVISATRIETARPMDTDLGYGWSSWKISYTTVFSYVEYYIDVYISSTSGLAEIEDAYDAEWYILTYNVDYADLSIPRPYETNTRAARAELYMEFSAPVVGGGSWNGWLRSDIKDMYLTVDANL